MMQVEPEVHLVDYQPNALDILLWTKNTRLAKHSEGLAVITRWSEEEKASELKYMLDTIQSSWEFVHYIFQVRNVSRAFTHQFVRTRPNSFAQQSQRTVDMSGFDFVMPNFLTHGSEDIFERNMLAISNRYKSWIDDGEPPQNARAILPEATATNIIVGTNLRTMSDTAKVRLCTRTQGEYQTVFRMMRKEILKVHPWAEPFIRVHCAATGVCCFPNYKECPIKPGIFDPETGGLHPTIDPTLHNLRDRPLTKKQIQTRWEELPMYEAVPKEMKSD